MRYKIQRKVPAMESFFLVKFCTVIKNSMASVFLGRSSCSTEHWKNPVNYFKRLLSKFKRTSFCSHLLKKSITEDIIFCAIKFVSTKSSALQSILKVNKRKTRFAQFGQSWNENTHLIQPLHESGVLLSSLNNFLWSER